MIVSLFFSVLYLLDDKKSDVVDELATVEVAAEQDNEYVLNKNTLKVHMPECDEIDKMSENNIIYYTGTPEELEKVGYSACTKCKPWKGSKKNEKD